MRIIARETWKARAATRSYSSLPIPVNRVAIHHTVTKDHGAETVRQIQNLHMDDRGWNDIGYNFLYSPNLNSFYVGRGGYAIGAHAGGHNATTLGLAILGDFRTDRLDEKTINSVSEFLRWCAHIQGYITPTAKVVGHRDLSATACPGPNIEGSFLKLWETELSKAMPTEEDSKESAYKATLEQIRDIANATLSD